MSFIIYSQYPPIGIFFTKVLSAYFKIESVTASSGILYPIPFNANSLFFILEVDLLIKPAAWFICFGKILKSENGLSFKFKWSKSKPEDL